MQLRIQALIYLLSSIQLSRTNSKSGEQEIRLLRSFEDLLIVFLAISFLILCYRNDEASFWDARLDEISFSLLIEECSKMKLDKRDLTKEFFCLSSLIYKQNFSQGLILLEHA